MSDYTGIEWSDATWNPVTGCTRVSEGCRNCYAERLAATRLAHLPAYDGVARMTPEGPRWTGLVRFDTDRLAIPLRWRKPRRVFVNSMSDLFHEALTNEEIAAVFGVMAACPQHVFQILTKRPARMLEWFGWVESMSRDRAWPWCRVCMLRYISPSHDSYGPQTRTPWPLPNVWLGVSAEDQATADDRIPILLQTPAAVRWVSAEPLLGPIDVRPWVGGRTSMHMSASVEGALANRNFRGLLDGDGRELSEAEAEAQLRALQQHGVRLIAANGCDDFDPETGCRGHSRPQLDWIVVGGESGPGARPMHPDWPRSIRDQCQSAGAAFLFKQWGEAAPFCALPPDIQHQLQAPSELTGEPFEPATLYRVGKHAAGRMLDGRTWDEYPGGDA